jgi:hypothetical protein
MVKSNKNTEGCIRKTMKILAFRRKILRGCFYCKTPFLAVSTFLNILSAKNDLKFGGNYIRSQ